MTAQFLASFFGQGGPCFSDWYWLRNFWHILTESKMCIETGVCPSFRASSETRNALLWRFVSQSDNLLRQFTRIWKSEPLFALPWKRKCPNVGVLFWLFFRWVERSLFAQEPVKMNSFSHPCYPSAFHCLKLNLGTFYWSGFSDFRINTTAGSQSIMFENFGRRIFFGEMIADFLDGEDYYFESSLYSKLGNAIFLN